MSRFFDGSSESEQSEHEDDVQPEIAAPVATRFDFESSSEDEEKRVIRSEKDKRFDEMQSSIKAMKNHIKIGDWGAVSKDFDLLNKQLLAAKNVVAKEGVPDFYFTQMISLEKSVADGYEQMKDDKKNSKKKFNPTNARALSALKQKLKKNRIKYQEKFEQFDKVPTKPKKQEEKEEEEEAEEEEEEDDQNGDGVENDEEEEEEEEPKKPVKKAEKKVHKKPEEEEEEAAEVGDDEDVEDEVNDDEDDEEEEQEEEEDDDDDIDLDKEITRDFWVKKEEKVTNKQKKIRKIRPAPAPGTRDDEDDKEEENGPIPSRPDVDISPELILQKLGEVIAKFGRRNTDRYGVIEDLKLLARKAQNPLTLLKIKVTLCSALFDFSVNSSYLPSENWRAICNSINDIIDMLQNNSSVRLSEDAKDVEETVFQKDDEHSSKIGYVSGSVLSYINRLFTEFRKCLQNLDPHSTEYVTRLQDETTLVRLMNKAQDYYAKLGKPILQSEVACLKLELLYYKYKPESDVYQVDEKKVVPSVETEVEKLALFLYKSADERIRIRAVLFHVYYLALHNRLSDARDRLLMSHVQDFINDTDIETRILFNRVMAQMGLCAFRTGDVKQALTCLSELHYTNRVKELLGQGINQRWNVDRDLDKEALEKLRQYPFHMHINIDSIDGVYLTSAMLVEVPNIVLFGASNKSKETRSFRRFFDSHSRQAFNGPPENTREIVMAASKSLLKSNWKKTQELLWRLKMWSTLPHAESIKAQFTIKIREVALKTYLLAYGPHYASVDLNMLANLFETPVAQVHKTVCKMIVDDQLQGSLDQPNKCVVMNATETSSLQKAALAFPEKITSFIEQNEKALEIRGGYLYNKADKKGWSDYGRSSYTKK